MALPVECLLVADQLEKYHPYTVEYRRPGSERYRDFGAWDPRTSDGILEAASTHTWAGDRGGLVSAIEDGLGPYGPPEPVLTNVRALGQENARAIVAAIKPLGFGFVALDLEGYRTGALNEVLFVDFSAPR